VFDRFIRLHYLAKIHYTSKIFNITMEISVRVMIRVRIRVRLTLAFDLGLRLRLRLGSGLGLGLSQLVNLARHCNNAFRSKTAKMHDHDS